LKIVVEKSQLAGEVAIPASKSHTIRAVLIGSLAEGVSVIESPLRAADTMSCVEVFRRMGAHIETDGDWLVHGLGGPPEGASDILDVGNSGTTLYLAMGTAALGNRWVTFTGDEQIRSRPAGPLLKALRDLGAECYSTNKDDKPPLMIKGPVKGGKTTLDGSKTSQYLSSLLLNCPLAQGDTEISVVDAAEIPYIEMTLQWLDEQGISYKRRGFEWFHVPGGQRYKAFRRSIPGDFSSATFFLCAAAVTGSEVMLLGLDMNDTQGDKAVVSMLSEMGAEVELLPEGIRIRGGNLEGGNFDLNSTPDALPSMAVTACFAEGTTRLYNVAQARLKETDRVAVMCAELSKMGARIQERPDGLVIHGSNLHGASVHGHGDHRVVMALAVAGLGAEGQTEIDTAEAVSITFPNFVELMKGLGAKMALSD